MKQYVIDELRPDEIAKILAYLQNHCEQGGLQNIFWIEIPEEILSKTQAGHGACGPHCAAVELHSDKVVFEFLIRGRKKIRCECVGYATPSQREFIMDFADNLLNTALSDA